jgi:hypothetical protein
VVVDLTTLVDVTGIAVLDVTISVVVFVLVSSLKEVETVVDFTTVVLVSTLVSVVLKVTVVIIQHAPEVVVLVVRTVDVTLFVVVTVTVVVFFVVAFGPADVAPGFCDEAETDIEIALMIKMENSSMRGRMWPLLIYMEDHQVVEVCVTV